MVETRIGSTQLTGNQFEKIRHAIGNARFVLINKESHGMQEFCAEITKALIERENFSLVLFGWQHIIVDANANRVALGSCGPAHGRTCMAADQSFGDGDEYFSAHENARTVLVAEDYYHESCFGSSLTWNIRDHAMVDTIVNALVFHDERLKAQFGDDHSGKLEPEKGASKQQNAEPPKLRAVIWTHNSHIGDAAATEQYERWSQVNVGHLVRQVLGKDNCFLIGLSTNTGTVRASKRWNGRDFVMDLNPALPSGTGDVLHETSKMQPELEEFGLFSARTRVPRTMWRLVTSSSSRSRSSAEGNGTKATRAVYWRPFDLVIDLDETSALHPLLELTEPKVPPSRPPTSLCSGTVDHSKWDKLAADEDDDKERA
ncbi:hypothetical protein FI667_g8132, partial [Globisporangium splendens]